MFCPNCGNRVEGNQKFCDNCGFELPNQDSQQEPAKEPESKKESTKQSGSSGNKVFDKWLEIQQAEGKEWETYVSFTSNEIWQFTPMIGNHTFENLITQQKEALNPQPYDVLEKIKQNLTAAASGGYWFWIATALTHGKELQKPRGVSLEKLANDYDKAIADEGLKKIANNVSPEEDQAMSRYSEFHLESLLKDAESLNKIPYSTIEALKTAILANILQGYLLAEVESKFRKH